MKVIDLKESTSRELLKLYAKLLEELRDREVVRSTNNPVADYCESLVVRALSLNPLERSHKGCDALDGSSGKRYEIKGRRITKRNPSPQLSVFRDLGSCHFDYLVGVLFDEEFAVTRACCVPWKVVQDISTHRKHVNGWVLHLRPSVWDIAGVRDVTSEVRRAQDDWLG